MRHSGFGINLLSALSTALLSFVCYAFVDDTDIAHCSTLQATAHEIIQEMQEVVDHWEGGLRTTGGALRVDKSFWYLIDFVWRNNEWHYATQTDREENFPFEEYQENASTSNELIPLKHVKPSVYTFLWTETTRNRSNK